MLITALWHDGDGLLHGAVWRIARTWLPVAAGVVDSVVQEEED